MLNLGAEGVLVVSHEYLIQVGRWSLLNESSMVYHGHLSGSAPETSDRSKRFQVQVLSSTRAGQPSLKKQIGIVDQFDYLLTSAIHLQGTNAIMYDEH